MNKNHKRSSRNKTTINRKVFGEWLFFLVILLFVFLIGRFSYIAIFKDVNNVNLKERTAHLYTQKQVIQAKRGTVYDASDKAIAEDSKTYSIYAVVDHTQKSTAGKPLYVTNKAKAAKVLAKYLPISETQALKTLSNTKPSTYQVEFGSAGNNISIQTKQKIAAQHISGLKFTSSPSREYPDDNFAAQLVGLAQPKTSQKTGETTLVGQMGIEQVFNKQMTGQNGIKKSKQDTSGYQIANTEQTARKAKNGDDVYTTFNWQLQTLLEDRVSAAVSGSHPEVFNAVVMNAKTGAIVAATQRPNYKSSGDAVWRNTLTQDAYEPGSTMKVVTMSAAIDSGNFNPNALYKSGVFEVGGGQVTDWNKSGWGYITYKEGFERSSNVAMANLEQTMGASTWEKYLKKFGFLQKTNVVGTAGEVTGSAPFSGALEQANTAFGQGITVNVMQMMQAFSAVANNGKMLKPYFVKKIVDPTTHQVVKSYGKQVKGQPISAKTAKRVRQYMEGVVYADDGTGSKYQIDGYRIAGKTGTAQISSSTGYEKGANSYVYSFVGMAPAKNPEYIMYVTIKKPQDTTKSAEEYLADVFNPVMKQALDSAKAAKQVNAGKVKMSQLVGQSTSDAQTALGKQGLTAIVIGSGNKVKQQSVTAGRNVLAKSKIFLITGGNVTMPDMTGWSQADVNTFAHLTNLKLSVSGSGFATQQSIKNGTKIQANQSVRVEFKQK